ncbi:hypothetical protein B0H67DRAFT_166860 [Lasiosphaeris hirsuta]|uniref:Uncharacterized protein n=1 Tax=Lasiosphaeris hirsuta TaxID=260670 RepID=A0AA40APX0_9PEZI|nr:hypothetical protein B0H67DRAFT_166860 [Lasiosphaeris hirsuta]
MFEPEQGRSCSCPHGCHGPWLAHRPPPAPGQTVTGDSFFLCFSLRWRRNSSADGLHLDELSESLNPQRSLLRQSSLGFPPHPYPYPFRAADLVYNRQTHPADTPSFWSQNHFSVVFADFSSSDFWPLVAV